MHCHKRITSACTLLLAQKVGATKLIVCTVGGDDDGDGEVDDGGDDGDG